MENGEQKGKEFSVEAADLEELPKVLDSSLSCIKWRLKTSARRRLEIDVLALCTGMRPVVMIDYGGKMPELQERLCALLEHSQKESAKFKHLRVMIIEDMIYLIHVRGLAEYIQSSLNSETLLLLVDLEQDPPKMITEAEKSPLGVQLLSIQKWFSNLFPLDQMNNGSSSCKSTENVESLVNNLTTSQSSQFIDLSSCMHDTQVTVPTLNGWLLGYPVVYAFGKEHIADAIYNLSTKPLHIFKILVCRNTACSKGSQMQELLSFTVPYDLSMGGSSEQWAKAYMAYMEVKWEKCKQAWRHLKMEVNECYPQAIAL
ncbi:uncharacterized protein LOC107433284 isoform X1 [Ziziphus jujuba]|uniref:Uncharacterized protein LOC107433284 isoform X1 n=2 Tax=Ziziphus jujuba TaxID=326968 RepID=A0A6P4AW40_ZIZJJ|nr:uncharacterized protein LOC107433284 isoform X1 [Ziziphus jujuba]